MWRIQGSGLPEWIRFRRNQKPAVATTPARKTPKALRRMPGGTMKITPTAIAAVAPEIVSLLPSAIPIARPATSSAPSGDRRAQLAAESPRHCPIASPRR